ncbi:DUF3696 domain-containing protein [Oscillospiraceae bacterium N12]|uniref:DUF3696 domain-containing protein n=1 Tax=Jilunia laotingensis TaxID=2763675 RepID=A0A926ISG0_9BACT|nr:DUF3696 domain-containing protein [Jilunia laotingensis]MBC8594703.1 DUF3696 domain-containing protein [Jilunia laotingensis]
MIRTIGISNFKLFKDKTNVPLSNLNLLTGVNGKGKSSVLQILLLLNQSINYSRSTNNIILNGNNVRLGNLFDVKNRLISSKEPINISFILDNYVINYQLEQYGETDIDLKISSISITINEKLTYIISKIIDDDLYKIFKNNEDVFPNITFSLDNLFIPESTLRIIDESYLIEIRNLLNFSNIHYVSADRIGPQNFYERKSLGNFVSVGSLGENTVNILARKGGDPVQPELKKVYMDLFSPTEDELTSDTIESYANYWLDKIFEGAEIKTEVMSDIDIIKFSIKPSKKDVFYKPTNVGYGFSYSLPILVAGLIAKKGDILIIENPEAHLHPYAQSILSKFLAGVSRVGVQVLVESHSEHILDGFRIIVHDKIIDLNEINILYFDKNDETYFHKIDIKDDGDIENWPTNFFDQSTNDLNYLYGI